MMRPANDVYDYYDNDDASFKTSLRLLMMAGTAYPSESTEHSWRDLHYLGVIALMDNESLCLSIYCVKKSRLTKHHPTSW